MTGIAFGWISPTSRLGSVVRNPNRSHVTSPSFSFRTDVHVVQIPAKKASGRASDKANHTGGREPSGITSFSEKLVNGTTHRLSTPSQRRQCGDDVFLTLVTPASVLLFVKTKLGEGMPQRAMARSEEHTSELQSLMRI